MGLKNFPQVPKIAYVCGFLPFLDPLHTITNFSARFPARLPAAFPTRISRKIFPQEFPARFSHKNFQQDFPELDPDWLAPHHPIPNAKFPPITTLLNRPTYHKSAKVSPSPFPKSYGNPKSMNKLTLNEPAFTTNLKNPMYIQIKRNFELTMFELNMPDLYIEIM